MRIYVTAALMLAAAAALGQPPGTTALICPHPEWAGRPVLEGCGNPRPQHNDIYRNPSSDDDLVRHDPDAIEGQRARNDMTVYRWTRWGDLQPGDLYDACLTPVTEGSGTRAGIAGPVNCTDWAMIAKAGPPAPKWPVYVRWQNPTHYVDDRPLPLDELASIDLEHGTCSSGDGFGNHQGLLVITGGVTWGRIELPDGEHCIRAFAKATNGARSDASNVVQLELTGPAPQSPLWFEHLEQPPLTGDDGYAYVLVMTRNRLALVPVGSVLPDTPCDPRQRITDYEGRTLSVIPLDRITFAEGVDVTPEVVFGSCSAD